MRSLVVGALALFPLIAGNAQEPVRKSFEPTRVVLDLKDAHVSAILEEMERQIGTKIPKGPMKNPVLPVFEADGTFWEVMDRLCQASGNGFRWSDRKG